ncbi:MAG: ABC transporter C-terminal domain-containing protein, partial [Bacteroidia bacterium]
FPGNYTQWRAKHTEEEKALRKQGQQKQAVIAEPVIEVQEPVVKRKVSFKEKYEFEQLEKEIPTLESEKSALTEKMAGLSDHGELRDAADRFAKLEKDLEEKTTRWLELADLMEA